MGFNETIAFWSGAFHNAGIAAWDWMFSQGWVLTALLFVVDTVAALGALTLSLFRRKGFGSHLRVVGWFFLATLTAYIMVVARFVAEYPEAQIEQLNKRIVELGGAPDVAVALTPAMRGAKVQVLEAIDELSEIVNRDMRGACDQSKKVLACFTMIRTSRVSDCEQDTNVAFMESTNILNKLWKNANEGFMVVGDDDVLKVLAQAIQPKDRQIFIDFYSALRNAYNELDFLALLTQDERPRLFEPALNISNSGNDLAQAAERYCSFIDKTNDRISSIRQQIN